MAGDPKDLLDDFYSQEEKPGKGWAFRPAVVCQCVKVFLSLVYFYTIVRFTGLRLFLSPAFFGTFISSQWLIGIIALVLFIMGKKIGWILTVISAVITLVLHIAGQVQALFYQPGSLLQTQRPIMTQVTVMMLNLLIIYFACNHSVTRYFNVNPTLRKSLLIISAVAALIISLRLF